MRTMNNLPPKSSIAANAVTSSKTKKGTGRWSILFIKGHGEIISVDRFKGIVFIFAFLMVVIIVTTACFYFLYKNKIKENENLKNTLTALEQKVVTLQDEKDVLMVRLVITEQKVKTDNDKTLEKGVEKPPETLSFRSASAKNKTGETATKTMSLPRENNLGTKKTADISGSVDKLVNPVQTKKPPAVRIEDLSVVNETKRNIVNVNFILKNTDPNSKTVKGRAFVVLKHEDADQNQWILLPSASFNEGKPFPINRGQYFSIANFKWMKFHKKIQAVTKPYNNATIFVFTTAGVLLLEKNFPL